MTSNAYFLHVVGMEECQSYIHIESILKKKLFIDMKVKIVNGEEREKMEWLCNEL